MFSNYGYAPEELNLSYLYFFFFFGHCMQLAGILVSPIRDGTWALLAEKAQSANQCTSGEVPVSTILNLNRFTGPRANFLNSAFSGSVHARRIVMGYQMEKRAIQVSTCLIDSLCCTEETNNTVNNHTPIKGNKKFLKIMLNFQNRISTFFWFQDRNSSNRIHMRVTLQCISYC